MNCAGEWYWSVSAASIKGFEIHGNGELWMETEDAMYADAEKKREEK